MENAAVKKPKIEAIYPLTAMQQGLLFHHLMEGEDQGFLIVQCDIEGSIDLELLKKAWGEAVQRHEVMRTSVHWKKVERPLLVVRPEKDIQWSLLDWRDKVNHEQEAALKAYKQERKVTGASLEESPLSQITLIQVDQEKFYFLWECHHLLLDGWSSTIILKDAFAIYECLYNNVPTDLPSLPTYKAYSKWLKSQNDTAAQAFWAKMLSGYQESSLFQSKSTQGSTESPTISKFHFTPEESNALKELAKYHKVTLNTLFQGIWSLTLAKFFTETDVIFGTTVSGRSIPFPHIDLMSGMFTNVLPVGAQLKSENSITATLQKLQSQQQEVRIYEYNRLDEVITWAALPEDKPLFDSLFVFENFPWENIKRAGLTISNFQGGITTTYPVTIIFKIEEKIAYELIVDTASIPNEAVSWISQSISDISHTLLSHKEYSVSQVLEAIEGVPETLSRKRMTLQSNAPQDNLRKKEESYLAPRNPIELGLVEIWEQLFGLKFISISDSFFELGGKSLMSVKMFTRVEEKLGVKLAPTTLLEFPTIAGLSKIIASKNNSVNPSWKYIVPIKTKGTKAPLFCIHAGGGHVFFYKDLADAIDKERPVYALQPVGIFGDDAKHNSIEEMARDYADEITAVQPEGVLQIVVYCFSTAVGLEMVAYLKSLGREAHLIVADTIAEHRLLLDKERLLVRTSAFFKRFLKNPFGALHAMIGYRIMFYLKPIRIKFFGSNAEKNTENMRLHLVDLFNAYPWHTKIESVSLVLTEKGDPAYNKEIKRSWKPLITQRINVEVCEGNHATFFEKPDVLQAARAIEDVIGAYDLA